VQLVVAVRHRDHHHVELALQSLLLRPRLLQRRLHDCFLAHESHNLALHGRVLVQQALHHRLLLRQLRPPLLLRHLCLPQRVAQQLGLLREGGLQLQLQGGVALLKGSKPRLEGELASSGHGV